MSLLMTTGFVPILSDKRIVSSASSKNVSYLPIIETREDDSAFAELLLQATEWIDVDFRADLETFSILDYVSQMCNRRSRLFKSIGTFEDGLEFLKCSIRDIWQKSVKWVSRTFRTVEICIETDP